MDDDEVYSASDAVNAEIVKDMLRAHGVNAYVENDSSWIGGAALPRNFAPRVRIANPAEKDRARDLIDAFEHGPIDAGRTWVCTGCGETLAGQFDRCWLCDTPR